MTFKVKRRWSLLLAVVMVFTMLPVSALAAGRNSTEFHIHDIDTLKQLVATETQSKKDDVKLYRVDVNGTKKNWPGQGDPATATGGRGLLTWANENGASGTNGRLEADKNVWMVLNTVTIIDENSPESITIYAKVNEDQKIVTATLNDAVTTDDKHITHIYLTKAVVTPGEPETYSVTYSVEGDTPEEIALPEAQSYKKGDAVTVAQELTTDVTTKGDQTGTWTFNGWKSESVEINDGKFTMPAKDVTIVGSWTFTPSTPGPGPDPETEKYNAGYFVLLPGKTAENAEHASANYYPYQEESVSDNQKVDYTTGYIGYLTEAGKKAVDETETDDKGVHRLTITADNYKEYLIVPTSYGELADHEGMPEHYEIVWYEINSSTLSPEWPNPSTGRSVAGYHVDGYVKDIAINVVYHSNFSTNEDEQKEIDKKADGSALVSGDQYTILDYSATELPERDGYTFTGWNTAQNGTGIKYTANSETTLMNSLVLYAQWEKDEPKPKLPTVGDIVSQLHKVVTKFPKDKNEGTFHFKLTKMNNGTASEEDQDFTPIMLNARVTAVNTEVPLKCEIGTNGEAAIKLQPGTYQVKEVFRADPDFPATDWETPNDITFVVQKDGSVTFGGENGDTKTITNTAYTKPQPPVVKTAELTISKTITGAALPSAFAIEIIAEDGKTIQLTKNSEGVEIVDATPTVLTWTVNMPVGTYTIAETGAEIDGYTLSASAKVFGYDKAFADRTLTAELVATGTKVELINEYSRNEPAPQAPAAPVTTDLTALLNGRVTVECLNAAAEHPTKKYGWLLDGAKIGEVEKIEGTYFCPITIYSYVYAKKYNNDTNTNHPVTVPNQEITLVWNGTAWEAANNVAVRVECNDEPVEQRTVTVNFTVNPEEGTITPLDEASALHSNGIAVTFAGIPEFDDRQFRIPLITAKEGYRFVGWKGRGADEISWDADAKTFGVAGLCFFPADSNVGYASVDAVFEPVDPQPVQKIIVTFFGCGNCEIMPGEGGTTVPNGYQFVLTEDADYTVPGVKSNDGYKYVDWVNDLTGTSTPWYADPSNGRLTWDSVKDIAYFDGAVGYINIMAQCVKEGEEPVDPPTPPVEETYTVTFAEGSHGSLKGQTVFTQIKKGSEMSNVVSVPSVSPNSRYKFTGWLYDGDGKIYSTAEVQKMAVTRNMTFTAQYKKKSSGGSSSSSSSSKKDKDDDEKILTDDHFAYIVGYTDGTVRPLGTITRSEVAAIYFRLLDEDYREKHLTSTNNFPDVQYGSWYNTSVSTLASVGIITGKSDGLFHPDDPITRAELATIVAKFSDLKKGKDIFSDVSGHWAESYINSASAYGWIAGYTDGTFRPDQYITRAEVMTLTNNVLERAVKEKNMHKDMRTWIDNQPGQWYYEAVQEATNSHEYSRTGKDVPGQDFEYENWEDINRDPDWSRYSY